MVIETEGQNPSETTGVSPGTASVFNLHQDVSKFYIGGVPESAKLPNDVTTRHFVGQIEEVEYHNEPIGLWNFAHSGQYETYGVPKRDQLRPEVVNAGLNFDGSGYMVMERGAWNPRKDMMMKFTFRTFAKNAMLFYMPHTTDVRQILNSLIFQK